MFKYIITSLHEAENYKKAFLVRICDTLEEAKSLLETLYKDAEQNKQGRLSKISNPKWLDENHTALQITATMSAGWITTKTTETLYITDEHVKNIYDKTPWIEY